MLGCTRFGLRCAHRTALGAAILCLSLNAPAQESLSNILERGHVARWLVCGPFPSHALADIEKGRPLLAGDDPLDPVGGISGVRPKHMMEVPTPSGTAYWQDAGARSPTLDLGPYFVGKDEGLAYAAFYSQSQQEVKAYVNLSSTLGARIYLNGSLVREIVAAPIGSGGSDRFLATFRRGTNLMVAALPGASYDALARHAGASAQELADRDRTRGLTGESGFEFSFTIAPTMEVGDLLAVPRLRETNTFSRKGGAILQDAFLTLFNPTANSSGPVQVSVSGLPGYPALIFATGGVPPGIEYHMRIGLPILPPETEGPATVEITIEGAGGQANFSALTHPAEPPQDGTVYLLPIPPRSELASLSQGDAVERRLSRFNRELALLEPAPRYGFHLGAVQTWRPLLSLRPESLQALRDAIQRARVAAHAGYGLLDERFVSGEAIVRNLLLGSQTTLAFLQDTNRSYLAWNAPALAPQTAQILANMDILGLISNLPDDTLPEVSMAVALNGDQLPHRHISRPLPSSSYDTLASESVKQRRNALEHGLPYDIALCESPTAGPKSYWLDAARAGASAIPKLIVSGASGMRYWEDVAPVLERTPDASPSIGRLLTTSHPGDLVTHAALKRGHWLAEQTTLTAEKMATLAALLGARYPDEALDLAWRQILHTAHPDRVGFPATPAIYLDTLAACREALTVSRTVLAESAQYVANLVDTYENDLSLDASALAVVVFNPSSWTRSDIATLTMEFQAGEGLTLMNGVGESVPLDFEVGQTSQSEVRTGRLRFVARNIPSLGYRTFYLLKQGKIPTRRSMDGRSIENEFFRVEVDTARGGVISRILDKATGVDIPGGFWNDLVAFQEDPQSNDRGREIWVAGGMDRSSENSATVKKLVTGIGQTLEITASFLGGKLTRRISLYQGIRRIECETHLKQIDAGDRLIAATFTMDGPRLAPIFGERFGAIVGKRASPGTRLRTGKTVPSVAAQPFLRWCALSPNDRLRLEDGSTEPLGPTTIVYPREPGMRQTARSIQRALLQRGVPADIQTADKRVTSQESGASDLLVILGGPSYNAFAQELWNGLDEDTGKRLSALVREKGRAYLQTRTLVLGGRTLEEVNESARAFAKTIAAIGIFQLSPTENRVSRSKAPPDFGLAILFQGPGLAMADRGGLMTLLLSHPREWGEDAERALPTSRDLSFSYALYPFQGSWREGQTNQAAHAFNEPFVTATTGLHLGSYDSELSFLSVDDTNFIITSVQPAANPVAAMSTDRSNPREGFIVRGYESVGRPTDVTLSLFAPLYESRMLTLSGKPGEPTTITEGGVRFGVDGFDIAQILLRPTSRIRRGLDKTIGDDLFKNATVYTRYWRHNRGAAPAGFQPLSLAIRGSEDSATGQLSIMIANHLAEDSITGVIALFPAVGWTVTPPQLDYTLEPGASEEQTVILLSPNSDPPAVGLVARTEFKSKTYRDTYNVENNFLTLAAIRDDEKITLTIENAAGIAAEGFAEIISPPEYWHELHGPSPNAGTLKKVLLIVPPYGRQTIDFFLNSDGNPPWVVAKVAANGTALYKTMIQEP